MVTVEGVCATTVCQSKYHLRLLMHSLKNIRMGSTTLSIMTPQHIDTQHNDTVHIDTQFNDTQHNTHSIMKLTIMTLTSMTLIIKTLRLMAYR
jgi:hypothetical protein